MIAPRRRAWRRLHGQEGTTIVELTVVLFILSIVAAIVFGFLASATETTTRTGLNEETQRSIMIAARTMTSDLRSLNTISAPGSIGSGFTCGAGVFGSPNYAGYQNCISISIPRTTAGATDCPKTNVTYGINGTNLYMDRAEVNCAGVTTVSTSKRLVLENVMNTSQSTPLFTYYDRLDRDMLAASPAVNPTAAAVIRLRLKVKYTGQKTGVLDFSQVVALRNKR